MKDISILVEAKNRYMEQLLEILVPRLYEGFDSLYEDALVLLDNEYEEKRQQTKSILKTFQDALKEIPLWNQDVIDHEYDRIVHVSNVDYLDDLIEAVFVAESKILTSVQLNSKNLKLKITVPTSPHFIHRCYICSAREIYKNPYVFNHYKDITPKDMHNNLREARSMIQDGIKNAIRDLLPIRDLLKQGIAKSLNDLELESRQNSDNESYSGRHSRNRKVSRSSDEESSISSSIRSFKNRSKSESESSSSSSESESDSEEEETKSVHSVKEPESKESNFSNIFKSIFNSNTESSNTESSNNESSNTKSSNTDSLEENVNEEVQENIQMQVHEDIEPIQEPIHLEENHQMDNIIEPTYEDNQTSLHLDLNNLTEDDENNDQFEDYVMDEPKPIEEFKEIKLDGNKIPKEYRSPVESPKELTTENKLTESNLKSLEPEETPKKENDRISLTSSKILYKPEPPKKFKDEKEREQTINLTLEKLKKEERRLRKEREALKLRKIVHSLKKGQKSLYEKNLENYKKFRAPFDTQSLMSSAYSEVSHVSSSSASTTTSKKDTINDIINQSRKKDNVFLNELKNKKEELIIKEENEDSGDEYQSDDELNNI